jgi:glutamate dehydrogenase (NAD(P)+)
MTSRVSTSPIFWDYLNTQRTLENYPQADPISNHELLELECEVLIPAATENQITSQNASRIRCRILAEGANGPTTADADEILEQNGVFRHPGHPRQRRRRDLQLSANGSRIA